MTHHLLPSLLLAFSASPSGLSCCSHGRLQGFFSQILDVHKPELREKYSEGSYGIPQMPRTKQLHSSGRHRYSWNLSKPEVTLGNPSGMFSVFTTRVEPTICTIHTLISSLITRAGLGRTTSASIAL